MVKIADRAYLEKRAAEFIAEAEADRYARENDSLDWNHEAYKKNLIRAIQCLALAIIKEE